MIGGAKLDRSKDRTKNDHLFELSPFERLRGGIAPLIVSQLNACSKLRYEVPNSAGVGTTVVLKLPYVIIVSIVWTLLLVVSQELGFREDHEHGTGDRQ